MYNQNHSFHLPILELKAIPLAATEIKYQKEKEKRYKKMMIMLKESENDEECEGLTLHYLLFVSTVLQLCPEMGL